MASIEKLKAILGKLADPTCKDKYKIMQTELYKIIFEENLYINEGRAELLLIGGVLNDGTQFGGLIEFAGQEPQQVFFQKKFKRSALEAIRIISCMINEKTEFEYTKLV